MKHNLCNDLGTFSLQILEQIELIRPRIDPIRPGWLNKTFPQRLNTPKPEELGMSGASRFTW